MLFQYRPFLLAERYLVKVGREFSPIAVSGAVTYVST